MGLKRWPNIIVSAGAEKAAEIELSARAENERPPTAASRHSTTVQLQLICSSVAAYSAGWQVKHKDGEALLFHSLKDGGRQLGKWG